jgi:predicted negative regulator of RcsB-dependent stress response
MFPINTNKSLEDNYSEIRDFLKNHKFISIFIIISFVFFVSYQQYNNYQLSIDNKKCLFKKICG